MWPSVTLSHKIHSNVFASNTTLFICAQFWFRRLIQGIQSPTLVFLLDFPLCHCLFVGQVYVSSSLWSNVASITSLFRRMFLTMVHWFLVVVQQLLGSWDCCLGQLLKDSAGCLKIYIHMGYYQYFKYILRLTTHPWITNPSNCLGRKFPRDAAVLFPWPIFTLSIERRGWCATETSPHSGQIPPPSPTHSLTCARYILSLCYLETALVLLSCLLASAFW